MGSVPIDRVLSCPNLPSLPGVALKVLELTRDPDVRLDALARTIENDPALASRVLRTVNSSYYALSKPCPTIGRALGFLGLNTVKSLVLGFSLVDSARGVETGGAFDLTTYWRRAIFSAAGARLFARSSSACDPDEAFLGALIQDIGMLASCAALKEEYASIVAGAGDDHAGLPEAERTALGFDHAQVGGELASKWRLPPQFVECIRCHHAQSRAALEYLKLVQVVCLGGTAAGVLGAPNPGPRLAMLVSRAGEWFGWDRRRIEDLLAQVAERAGEVASLLEVKTGGNPDVNAILAEANSRLVDHQVETQRETQALKAANEDLAKQSVTDALTGAFNRKRFDAESARLFADASARGSALGLLFIDADRFKSVNDAHGHAAGDAVLIELARRLADTAGPRGVVCRYGGEEFAVLLPGIALAESAAIAEELRAAIESAPFDIRRAGASVPELPVTISVGVAATGPDAPPFTGVDALVHAADECVYRAKKLGRNRVNIHTASTPASTGVAEPQAREATAPPAALPDAEAAAALRASPALPARPAAADPSEPPRTVLMIEDDPMAARFFSLLCSRTGVRVVTATTAGTALEWLASGRIGGGGLPDMIVCDIELPDVRGPELIGRVRALAPVARIPIVVLTSSVDPDDQAASMQAGATLYIRKDDFCLQMSRWLGVMARLWGAQARAA
ncbi:MAG: HDOD domain-containing protein [Phycisphaerales bacterium]|nr:HDOD domain-containing protein [Phycisphaerales bacterium]